MGNIINTSQSLELNWVKNIYHAHSSFTLNFLNNIIRIITLYKGFLIILNFSRLSNSIIKMLFRRM